MFIMGYEDSPDCAKCGMTESAIHVITECPMYVGARMAILGMPTFNAENIRTLNLNNILKFVRTTKLWDL